MKTNWSFDLPINGTKEQHIAIKNTLEAIGYNWSLNSDVPSWKNFNLVYHDNETFAGSNDCYNIKPNHFSSFLDFLVWHFTGEEENKEQKEIRDIRNKMEQLAQRLKQLEGGK